MKTQCLGIVVHIVYFTMRNRPYLVIQRFSTSDVYHRVLETFIREPVRVLRILDGDAVYLKAVWIDIRNDGTESDGPYSVLTLLHFCLGSELGADDHRLCMRCI